MRVFLGNGHDIFVVKTFHDLDEVREKRVWGGGRGFWLSGAVYSQALAEALKANHAYTETRGRRGTRCPPWVQCFVNSSSSHPCGAGSRSGGVGVCRLGQEGSDAQSYSNPYMRP